jgi:hypothetical protein
MEVIFQILKKVTVQITVFSDITPCNPVESYQHLDGKKLTASFFVVKF